MTTPQAVDVEGLLKNDEAHFAVSTFLALYNGMNGLDAMRSAMAPVLTRLQAAEARAEDLARKVFVPGVHRCAKCGLRLISSAYTQDGSVHANQNPQDCPNGCGPMWPVTEREAGNDLCDKLEAAEARNAELEARVAVLGAPCDLIMTYGDGDNEGEHGGDHDDPDCPTCQKIVVAQNAYRAAPSDGALGRQDGLHKMANPVFPQQDREA